MFAINNKDLMMIKIENSKRDKLNPAPISCQFDSTFHQAKNKIHRQFQRMIEYWILLETNGNSQTQ